MFLRNFQITIDVSDDGICHAENELKKYKYQTNKIKINAYILAKQSIEQFPWGS